MKILGKLKKALPANTFRKNVALMFSGTVVSQVLYLLTYPILTRIYSTENFGRYAIFISFLSILAVLATGQYEIPILLPKKEKNLSYLTYGVVSISVIMSILITIMLFFALPILEKYEYFDSYLEIAFLGTSVFVFSFYQIQFYLSLRNQNFKSLSIINIVHVMLTAIFQYFLAMTELKGIGLAIGYIGGIFIASVLLYFQNKGVFSTDKKFSELIPNIKSILVRYKRFPLFNLPATFINLSANQVPQLLLNTFGQSVVGQFSLSQRVLGSPVTLFSNSVSHVFKERASSDYRNKGNCRGIFVQTFKSLFLISIVPFLLIFFLAPTLVPIIFGKEWDTAGLYIRALTLMYFFKFTVSPLSYVIVVAEKQNLNFLLQFVLLISSVLSIGVGIYKSDPLISVVLYSIFYSVVYFLFLGVSYKLSLGVKVNNLSEKSL